MGRALLWFRRDLRLTDNPALQGALGECAGIIPLYIHAPDEERPWQPGAASRWWLHHSLQALDSQLRRCGSRLLIRPGPTAEVLRSLVEGEGITHLFWNRLYEPQTIHRDRQIEQQLSKVGVICRSFNSALLFEPWEIENRTGAPYRVFTPFWRNSQQRLTELEIPSAAPVRLPTVADTIPSHRLDKLELLPKSGWDEGLSESWRPGETGALEGLSRFLQQGVETYHLRRDLPGTQGSSRLSPHLHFGEIGPRQIVQALLARRADLPPQRESGEESYLRELGWREFAYHLLYHYPESANSPLNPKFRDFPWVWAKQSIRKWNTWRQGLTGIPIVDAGMRELWRTGWMHNRVRMIVASLLTKNVGIHWLEGARWFWDTLVDADLANNTLGWQWTAGCGADAAPYFRIFNPVRQGQQFDREGRYVRRWIGELANLPDEKIHAPWLANSVTLRAAGVELDKHYPSPVVDLTSSREDALSRWNRIKSTNGGAPV
jgi:deoxyribodipyrimidine photo-lyase